MEHNNFGDNVIPIKKDNIEKTIDNSMEDQPFPGEIEIPKNLQQLISVEEKEKLEKASTSDFLTGLLNRRGFEQELLRIKKINNSSLYENNKRENLEQKEYALLALDIDTFKSFNDTYGHAAGDAVLKESALFLQKHFRTTDTAFRFGGEEFIVLLQDIDKSHFIKRLSQQDDSDLHSLNFKIVLKKIENSDYIALPYNGTEETSSPDQNILVKTISFSGGLVSFDPHNDDVNEVIARADELLYQAKESGRNQIHKEKYLETTGTHN